MHTRATTRNKPLHLEIPLPQFSFLILFQWIWESIIWDFKSKAHFGFICMMALKILDFLPKVYPCWCFHIYTAEENLLLRPQPVNCVLAWVPAELSHSRMFILSHSTKTKRKNKVRRQTVPLSLYKEFTAMASLSKQPQRPTPVFIAHILPWGLWGSNCVEKSRAFSCLVKLLQHLSSSWAGKHAPLMQNKTCTPVIL